MNSRTKKFSLSGLRWILGLVVLLESLQFVFSRSVGAFLAQMNLPPWIRPALGGGEVLAVLLFLFPATFLLGGYLLLIVFGIAIALHVVHGQYEVGSLLVYIMAVIVCMVHRDQAALDVAHDR
jgi:hypothetical protein